MRYTITSAQCSHLYKEGQLELAEIYPQETISTLSDLVAGAKAQTGRDLHRENPPLLFALGPSMLGQLASQLFKKQLIKIAFTQKLPCFESEATLQAVSSVTEIVGGALINLRSGNILFFLSDTPLDFSHRQEQLLVAFCTQRGRYAIQERDPHTHWLKHLGYASGDRLSEATHPLIHKVY